jgi:CBS domain-containing protein
MNTTVKDVMLTKEALGDEPAYSEHAAKLMYDRRVKRFPVTDENGAAGWRGSGYGRAP